MSRATEMVNEIPATTFKLPTVSGQAIAHASTAAESTHIAASTTSSTRAYMFRGGLDMRFLSYVGQRRPLGGISRTSLEEGDRSELPRTTFARRVGAIAFP